MYEAALPGNGAGRRQYGRCCATSLGWRLSARRWPLSAQLTGVSRGATCLPTRPPRSAARAVTPCSCAARCGTDWRLVVLQVCTVAACLSCTISLEAVCDTPHAEVPGPFTLSDSSELCIWRAPCSKACTCAVRMQDVHAAWESGLSAPAINDPAMHFVWGGGGGRGGLFPGRCVLSAVKGGGVQRSAESERSFGGLASEGGAHSPCHAPTTSYGARCGSANQRAISHLALQHC